MNRYIQYMYSYPHKTAYRPLKNVNLQDYFCNLEGEGHSLYLHLPFCESKCGYCNLFSITGCNRLQIEAYLDAVLRQVRQYKEMLPQRASFDDFTIGGGTPLLLEKEQITRVFEMVAVEMPMSAGHKIVIETAPNQTNREKAELLKKLGVTRVSMGIQSFDDGELKWLRRNHDSMRAREAADLLANMGFACVNFDFIYGLPGQTADSLIHSLETALSFSPDEIFLYPLYIKHGVWLEREGRKELLDSDHAYELYQCGAGYLRENGYVQMSMRRFVRSVSACCAEEDAGKYFMRNASANRVPNENSQTHLSEKNSVNRFGRKNNECDFMGKHARSVMPEFNECGLKSALSIGCGGRSYLGRLHTCTPYRTTRAAAWEEIRCYQHTEDFSSVTNGILLSDDEIRRRYVIKHLLILPGISIQAYQRTFRSDVLDDFPLIRDWMECGWLEQRHIADAADSDFLALTQEGLGLSDYIGPQLISEDVRQKMLEWERENA